MMASGGRIGRLACGLVAALAAGSILAPASATAQVAGGAEMGTTVDLATSRPDPEGTPTAVSVTCFLLDVENINDLSQDFTADFYIVARWSDHRLSRPESSGESSSRLLPLSEIWDPQIGIFNRRDAQLLLPPTARVDGAGNVELSQRIRGRFSSPLDLRQFPFDRQQLEIRFLSYRYSSDELTVEVDRVVRHERFSIAGWRIGPPVGEHLTLEIEGVGDRAGLTLRVDAERQRTFYLLTLVVPLVLISMMAWAVFWIDPTLLPSQIAVSTSSVFTLIAFRLSLMWSLPKISYVTTADKFVLAVTVLVFAALGEAVLTGRLSKSGREELARRVDRWARWIYASALIVICLAVLT